MCIRDRRELDGALVLDLLAYPGVDPRLVPLLPFIDDARVDDVVDTLARPLATVNEPPGTDVHAIHSGLISVTPLGLDLTHQELMGTLPSWEVPGYQHLPSA